ncbi:MAG: YggS family pyridoxal phosphate-dependent enzyme [Melioribacteraceae bacterium]|nr:YggS family pyridoxal phosphate-dependent enzyme [Melioribacteraceae bacterium]
MIAENLKILKEKVNKTCEKTGRNPSEITVVAVSKTNPLSVIKEAYGAGITDFGENKAQELRDKSGECDSDINWHFIGHLQKNKVKYVIKPSVLIHSVDSETIAEEINKRAASINKIQNILLEVNTSGEESKHGLKSEEDVLALVEYCINLRNVNVKGLMTMAPFTDNQVIIRQCFSMLRTVRNYINSRGYALTELSMGMTNDFETAIEEGSTILRIGTAIFGERNYS